MLEYTSETDHGNICPTPPRISVRQNGADILGETPLRIEQWEEKLKQDNNKSINLEWIQTSMLK